MKWSVHFSRQPLDFLESQGKTEEYVLHSIKDAILKFQGEDVSLDIKKLKGEWEGYFRIRKGKWRIIASFDFKAGIVHIEVIDWRGNIY